MKLYNTLTRTIQEFQPLDGKTVRMYVCGPTVYDDPHLGHARSAYIFDVLRRYLTYKGFTVKFVRNVTDVDDKIIEKARQETVHSPQSTVHSDLKEKCRVVAEKYLDHYHEVLRQLGIESPDLEPKATDHVVPEMTDFIAKLLLQGVAYEAGGDVYFAVRKHLAYGKLSNRTVDELQAGARVEPGERKQDPLDFALWKKAKPSEPSWNSPWGEGRPGWHIECSAMSTKYLGDQFDIHGGGVDLVFPHHENEIAQAESAGKSFARYWIHNGLLTVNGEKMSKSGGNFITVNEVLSRYDADLIKIFFLSAHYRSPADFSWERMEAVKSSFERFDALLSRLQQLFGSSLGTGGIASMIGLEVTSFIQRFESALDDDLNTPQALAVLYELASYGLQVIERIKERKAGNLFVNYLRERFLTLANILGLLERYHHDLPPLSSEQGMQDERIERLVHQRDEARKRGDFETADSIRKELTLEHILLEDTPQGTVWRRKRW